MGKVFSTTIIARKIMIDLSLAKGVKMDEDSLGGGSFVWESDIYDCVVDMAYLSESKGGATFLNLTLLNGKKKLKESFCIISGEEKGKKTFYIGKDGVSHPLPGWTQAYNLCMTSSGETLTDIANNGQTKTINIYNFDKRKELPTETDHVLVDLIGKSVKAGVIKQLVNKRVKQGNVWVDTADSKEENTISQFFHAETGLTVAEASKDIKEASFINKWLSTNKDKTRDKRSIKTGTGASTAADKPAGKKLFG
jgi:hypothetical protein